MQKLAALVITSFLAAPAFASSIAPESASICTRDFNSWGQSSHCECPDATRYEDRIGQCVQGLPVEIAVEGYIYPSRNEDGDVVAYRIMKNGTESYKIALPFALREKFSDEKLEGTKILFKGEVVQHLSGNEVVETTIIVNEIDSPDLSPEIVLFH
ncbi:MAG: hypothetical protein EOP10_05860 [Proteobacteria bacterium]|nr:MAG: hypothetical protein EOP10_05860 [Pseudomonadota bacterium]